MTYEVGHAALSIYPSFKGFGNDLERGTSKAMIASGVSGGTKFGDAAGKSAGKRFGSLFKSAAKASLFGIAGAGALAVKVGADSVELASDLNESVNAVNVSYGKQAKAVQKLGREAATSLGLSNNEFNSLSVRFSAFSKTIAGGAGKAVVTTLGDLTTRAADFASVMNLEVNEAAELFQSGLAGETEPLRKFGVDLSAAAVEAHAYAVGIADVGDKLTEGEKVQARYSLLMKDTRKTHGDFANTSDSLANRQRILNARWDDARAKLGAGLLPVIEDVTGFLLDKGIPAFEDFSAWFNQKGLPAIQDFATEARPLVKELLPAMGTALGDVRDVLGPASRHAKDLVGAFNDMPEWAKTAIVGGGGALLLGKKLGLGKAAGGVLSKATPVPVFVTNPGFGGTPGPGGKPPKAGLPGKIAPGLVGLGAAATGVSGAAVAAAGGLFAWAEPLKKGGKVPGIVAGFLRDTFEGSDKAEEGLNKVSDKARVARGDVLELGEALNNPYRMLINSSELLTAIERARTLNTLVSGLNYNGMQGVTPSEARAAGVTFTGPINVVAHDYNDFTRQTQNRARRAASDGIPRGAS